jgi:hypothetical protein
VKRRNFLKGMLAAPMAAKGVVTEALAKSGIVGPNEHNSIHKWFTTSVHSDTAEEMEMSAPVSIPDTVERALTRLAKRYAAKQKDFYDPKNRIGARRSVRYLDPDLASYKSFSASTLQRIQGERNYHREYEDDMSYLDILKARILNGESTDV